MEEVMAEEGYYELQALDHAGWSLRNRFPSSADDPLVVMRARAEAEQLAQEPAVRGVELVHEYLDAKTNEVRREAVYSWGSARATMAAGSSTASSRSSIMRTARAAGRTRPARGAARLGRGVKRKVEVVPVEPADAPVDVARRRRAKPWWRSTVMMVIGSLAIAAGATALIWTGLSHQLPGLAGDPQPVAAAFFSVILVGGLAVLFFVQRGGGTGLFTSAAATRRAAAMAAGAPGGVTTAGGAGADASAVIETPAPVAPAPPKPRAMTSGEAVVEVQENRLLRFLRECMLHKDMRAALTSDGTLRDPHIVFGVHLFLLGAAEVCVTDTSSGVSDRAHLVKVMKALMRAIGSPEDRAEAFVVRLEAHRQKPEEHTMILLGQLAMDHYLEQNQVQDGALSKALMRWASPPSE
jgi:hypothetical protein